MLVAFSMPLTCPPRGMMMLVTAPPCGLPPPVRLSSLAVGWDLLKVWVWPWVSSWRGNTRRDPLEDPTHSSPQGDMARAVIAPTLNAWVEKWVICDVMYCEVVQPAGLGMYTLVPGL